MNKPTPELLKLLLQAHDQFVSRFSVDGRLAELADAEPDELRRVIQDIADSVCDHVWTTAGVVPSPDQHKWLAESVLDEAFGMGPLDPLLRDKTCTAIVIRGPRSVWVESSGELRETATVFADDKHLQRTLQRQPKLKPYLERVAGDNGHSPSWRIDLSKLRIRQETGATV